MRRANVRPLGEIRFPEHDRTRGTQAFHERRIAMRDVVREREGSRGRRRAVARFDIVFHEHGDTRESAVRCSGAACCIARACVVERVRVRRNHAP
jgi:hypothetical protein